MQQKLHGLDHLRAFAIVFVFLFHYQVLSHGEPGWLPEVARFGWTGVDLFFVLSGFLISSQLFLQIKESNTISFKIFFLKRAFRILPAYWLIVIIYFCVPFFPEKKALPPLWEFLTFTQNFGLDLQHYGAFSHAWSLCVEEHFYLFLPLVLIVFLSLKAFKKAYWLLIALFIAGFAIRMYSYDRLYLPYEATDNSWMHWYKYIYYPTYNRLDGLLVGVSIAACYNFLPGAWNRIAKYGNLFFLLGLAILTAAYFLCYDSMTRPASIYGFPLVALGYGCIVTGAVSPDSFLYRSSSKITTFIATLSYAVYLSHKGIIHMTHKVLEDFHLNNNILLIIAAATSIIAAWLLHLAIERPFLKLRNRLLKIK